MASLRPKGRKGSQGQEGEKTVEREQARDAILFEQEEAAELDRPKGECRDDRKQSR